MDERCRLSTPNAAGTANALIYGHNTASGSMFSQLLNYADKAFYTAHPTFQFDTLYEEGTWQVAAVLRTELGADALPYYSFLMLPRRKNGSSAWMPFWNFRFTIPALCPNMGTSC